MSILSGFRKVKKYVKTTTGYKLLSQWTSAQTVELDDGSTLQSNLARWDDKYTRTEIDNKFSTLETNIDWKESVDCFEDIMATYPNPVDGWTVNVKDTDYTYRWNGSEWVAISANAIPKATEAVDGLLSKENKVKYDDANAKKHIHENKDVLDEITAGKMEQWNSMSNGNVSGVKGDAESSYRTGEVNLTPADIGLGNYSATAINLVQEDPAGNSQVNVIKTGEKAHAGRLVVSSAGNFGVYDETFKKWLLKSDTSGNVEVNGIHASSFLGNNTGYVYPVVGEGNANDVVSEFHKFCYSLTNAPVSGTHGFLDVSCFDGSLFNPDGKGGMPVVRQVFTKYDDGRQWIRMKMRGSWTAWRYSADSGAATSAGMIRTGDYFARVENPGSGYCLMSASGSNRLNLGGAPDYTRWGQIYSTNSVISTSDRTLKHDISYMGKKSVYDTQLTDEQTEQLIMGIKPAVFRFNDGTSGRPHHGILSQDLEQTLEQIGIDHGAFIKSPKTRIVEREDGTRDYEVIKDEYIYSVRYEELIADIIRFVQLQQERITDLETRLQVVEQNPL